MQLLDYLSPCAIIKKKIESLFWKPNIKQFNNKDNLRLKCI